jgi:putative ATPase
MHVPLYEQIRPSAFGEIAGQEHLVGERGFLTRAIQSRRPISLLLCGPPGCGKTTLARLYARAFDLPFFSISGVFQSSAELKKILKEGQETPLWNRQTLLFVDEIHRLNRAQQDIFLPFLEEGSAILVGATTENPSFALNGALLSRLRVLTLHPLSEEHLDQIARRYESLKGPLPVTPRARQWLLSLAQGDARHLINLIDTIADLPPEPHDIEELSPLLQKRQALYDKDREGHYNLISALHKSIRGSDPDAALYWLSRMFEGGEDRLFIARRLLRCASEDVGLADPQALSLAVATFQTYEMLGSPEGELALAQLVLYLALAPKSNSVYKALGQAQQLAGQTGHLAPPKVILNAPTNWMKQEGYLYDHDTAHGFSGQNYFPEGLERPTFYSPVERGFEREMKKRLEYFQKLRSAGGTTS